MNDTLLTTSGVAGKNRSEFVADIKPQTVTFTPPVNTFEHIVHVANFDYAKGGMNRSILFGSPDDIALYDRYLFNKDFFLWGALLIACFYSLIVYLLNREEKISFYFALICLIFICRIPLAGSYSLYEIIPSASIHLFEWINYNLSCGHPVLRIVDP